MKFTDKLQKIINKNNSLLCVGLDTDFQKIPAFLRSKEKPVFEFNKQLIDKTYDLVCSYKLQIAYYSALGNIGLKQLADTIDYIKQNHPEILIILDSKRGDIGNTSEQYAKEAFEVFMADAVTLNPYMGFDSLEPFIKYDDKGLFILCKTSNEGSSDFQNLEINGVPLYIKVAQKVTEWNKINGNCMLVVGATHPEELGKIRNEAKDLFFLVPGIGFQGGDLQKTLQLGLQKNKSGLIINSSRNIIYAGADENFADLSRLEAEKLKNNINSLII